MMGYADEFFVLHELGFSMFIVVDLCICPRSAERIHGLVNSQVFELPVTG
jgi:hypothetical protein